MAPSLRISLRTWLLCISAGAMLAASYLLVRIPWRFAAATILIVIVAVLVCRKDGVRLLGIAMSRRHVFLSVALFALLAVTCRVLILFVTRRLQLVYYPFESQPGQPVQPTWSVIHVFQALNDEMVLRALLLTVLIAYLGNRTSVVIGAAAFFAGLHF